MYSRPIVPHDFKVPERLEADGFHLRMLTVNDVIKDFDAIIVSRDHLKTLMPPGDPWPDCVTVEENLIDLGWHQREFTLRHSFCYTVMSPNEARCLGACYIDPSDRQGFEAQASYWARADELASGLEERIGRTFRDWLRRDWPFASVAFPGRDIPWTEWNALPPRV